MKGDRDGTCDYNAYFQTTNTPTETNGQVSDDDPFVNSASDYHLVAHTDAGANLGSPYKIDLDGVTRAAWDRGTYEDTDPPNPYMRFY